MKKNLFKIIIFSLLFGLLGGVGGELMARLYLLQNTYKVPLFGDVNVPENVYGGSNLIIESPKKVIVEQNTKVVETAKNAQKNIVAIFKKNTIKPKKINNQLATTTLNIENYYNLQVPLAQGFIVTSDGWIMSNFVPTEMSVLKKQQATSTLLKIKKDFISQYVIITQDRIVYDLVDVNLSVDEQTSFWRINANDLGVRQFKSISEITNGELVIITDFYGHIWLTTVVNKYSDDLPLVLSSDKNYAEIKLANFLNKNIKQSFIFDINGNLLALGQADKKIIPISVDFSCINCLLDGKKIAKPYLGLNYINLHHILTTNKNIAREGALIYPNNQGVAIVKKSPADLAGLLSGDIIIAVNAIQINKDNNLSDLITQFNPGEKLNLTIIRNNQEKQVLAVLDELR